jgi:hypothetical protein
MAQPGQPIDKTRSAGRSEAKLDRLHSVEFTFVRHMHLRQRRLILCQMMRVRGHRLKENQGPGSALNKRKGGSSSN